MGHCIEKMGCDKCGSGNGLQVFEEEGKFTGFCFACDTYYPDPYGDNPDRAKAARRAKPVRSPEDVAEEIRSIKDDYRTVDVRDRGLKAFALEHFGIKTGLSEQDGESVVTHYYPYRNGAGELTGYKVRLVQNKFFYCVGSVKGAKLFGWQEALSTGARRLFITEGELDTVALYQALMDSQRGTKYADYHPAVVSVPSGAVSAKAAINEHLSEIRANFKEVVLVFDQDEPGRQATEEVLKILPTARTVTLPAKDANACIIEGRAKALCNAVLFKAETPKNTRLVMGSSLFEAGRKQAEWGFSWPWKKLNDLTRGIRLGETIYLGAGVKMGKSELVNALAAHLIQEHGWTVFLAKPEEANRKSYQMLLSKIAGKIFHDPNIPFDYNAYDEASKYVGDKAIFLDLYQHMGWEALKADIMMAASMGAKAIFIDPITNLVNGAGSGEQNTMLQEIAQELAAMAKDLNIVVFIFCHLKAPLHGEPHERGGKVFSHQFAGSRAMMRSCNLMIGLEGNKDPALPNEERNIRNLVLLEDREFGATGEVGLYWHDRTGLFNEINH